MSEVVKMITHPDGKRRMVIFRCADGTYGFEEQYWADGEHEQAWCPVGGYCTSITDSAVAAEREARGRVAWLEQLDD